MTTRIKAATASHATRHRRPRSGRGLRDHQEDAPPDRRPPAAIGLPTTPFAAQLSSSTGRSTRGRPLEPDSDDTGIDVQLAPRRRRRRRQCRARVQSNITRRRRARETPATQRATALIRANDLPTSRHRLCPGLPVRRSKTTRQLAEDAPSSPSRGAATAID